MQILKKLLTALRGGATEVGEAIVDSQALRILDQEIREAEASLTDARNQQVKILGKHKQSLQRIEEFNRTIADWENKAIQALQKDAEGLATECAEQVARLTNERDQEQVLADQFGASIATLSATIGKTDASIKGMKQQVDLVKARESVQKAQVSAAAATGGANGRLETAFGSLDRIKRRQDEQAAQLEAAAELAEAENGGDLNKRLEAIGIGAKTTGADDVIARLRAKAGQTAQ